MDSSQNALKKPFKCPLASGSQHSSQCSSILKTGENNLETDDVDALHINETEPDQTGLDNTKKTIEKKSQRPLTDEEYEDIFTAVLSKCVQEDEYRLSQDEDFNKFFEARRKPVRIEPVPADKTTPKLVEKQAEKIKPKLYAMQNVAPRKLEQQHKQGGKKREVKLVKGKFCGVQTQKSRGGIERTIPRSPPNLQPAFTATAGSSQKQSKKKMSAKEKMLRRNIEESGTWTQCGKRSCGKWRYLTNHSDPALIPDYWECSMNPDDEYNSCAIPEADYDETHHILTQFTEGSIVWAKMAGYPWWPALVEIDPDLETYVEVSGKSKTSPMNPTHYHVVYLDKFVTRAWIKTDNLKPYSVDDQVIGSTVIKGHNYLKEILMAKHNALDALGLSIKDRLRKYGFGTKYRGKWRIENFWNRKLATGEQKQVKEDKMYEDELEAEQSDSDSEEDDDDDQDDDLTPDKDLVTTPGFDDEAMLSYVEEILSSIEDKLSQSGLEDEILMPPKKRKYEPPTEDAPVAKKTKEDSHSRKIQDTMPSYGEENSKGKGKAKKPRENKKVSKAPTQKPVLPAIDSDIYTMELSQAPITPEVKKEPVSPTQSETCDVEHTRVDEPNNEKKSKKEKVKNMSTTEKRTVLVKEKKISKPKKARKMNEKGDASISNEVECTEIREVDKTGDLKATDKESDVPETVDKTDVKDSVHQEEKGNANRELTESVKVVKEAAESKEIKDIITCDEDFERKEEKGNKGKGSKAKKNKTPKSKDSEGADKAEKRQRKTDVSRKYVNTDVKCSGTKNIALKKKPEKCSSNTQNFNSDVIGKKPRKKFQAPTGLKPVTNQTTAVEPTQEENTDVKTEEMETGELTRVTRSRSQERELDVASPEPERRMRCSSQERESARITRSRSQERETEISSPKSGDSSRSLRKTRGSSQEKDANLSSSQKSTKSDSERTSRRLTRSNSQEQLLDACSQRSNRSTQSLSKEKMASSQNKQSPHQNSTVLKSNKSKTSKDNETTECSSDPMSDDELDLEIDQDMADLRVGSQELAAYGENSDPLDFDD